MKNKITKFIFDIDVENKKTFKAMAARSGLSMVDILNDLIKKNMNKDKYEITK